MEYLGSTNYRTNTQVQSHMSRREQLEDEKLAITDHAIYKGGMSQEAIKRYQEIDKELKEK